MFRPPLDSPPFSQIIPLNRIPPPQAVNEESTPADIARDAVAQAETPAQSNLDEVPSGAGM